MPEPLPEKLKNHYHTVYRLPRRRHYLFGATLCTISDKFDRCWVSTVWNLRTTTLIVETKIPSRRKRLHFFTLPGPDKTAKARIDGLLRQEQQTGGAITKELRLELSTEG
jgi:hypothetical protein